jgi:uncharacterized repeat protein (TIGR01451 family)
MASHNRIRGFGSIAAVALVAGLTLVVTAGGSGAATGRGTVCSFLAGSASHGGRGSSCADLTLTLTHEFDRVEIGRPFKAKIAIANNGPTTAFNVTASDTLPTTMTFVGSSASQGSCSGPPVGSTGVVNCTIGAINPGSTVNLRVRMRPTATGVQNNQASTSASTPDPNGSNNSDSDPIDVQTNSRGCTLIGTQGDDVITGTGEEDVICGLRGADQIDGGGANDVLYGERGADQLTDHNGNDTLRGGDGGDSLDTADGVAGDTANGGFGVDTCTTDGSDTELNC